MEERTYELAKLATKRNKAGVRKLGMASIVARIRPRTSKSTDSRVPIRKDPQNLQKVSKVAGGSERKLFGGFPLFEARRLADSWYLRNLVVL